MKSSYRKLKDKIAALEEDKMYMYRDIRAILKYPDSGQTAQIKWQYAVMFDIEEITFWGDPSKVKLQKGLREKSEEMKGFYDKMTISPGDLSEIMNPYQDKPKKKESFKAMADRRFGRMGQAMVNFYKKKDGKR